MGSTPGRGREIYEEIVRVSFKLIGVKNHGVFSSRTVLFSFMMGLAMVETLVQVITPFFLLLLVN